MVEIDRKHRHADLGLRFVHALLEYFLKSLDWLRFGCPLPIRCGRTTPQGLVLHLVSSRWAQLLTELLISTHVLRRLTFVVMLPGPMNERYSRFSSRSEVQPLKQLAMDATEKKRKLDSGEIDPVTERVMHQIQAELQRSHDKTTDHLCRHWARLGFKQVRWMSENHLGRARAGIARWLKPSRKTLGDAVHARP